MRYTYLSVFYLIFLTIPIYSQNYNETLGDYKFELIGHSLKQTFRGNDYECELKIYNNNELINSYNYYSPNGDFQRYEMKKFTINEHTGEEVIFFLLIHEGANYIGGELYCIFLSKVAEHNNIIQIPQILEYSKHMNLREIDEGDTYLNSLIQDLNNNGEKEIIDYKVVQLNGGSLMTASGITKISKLVNGHFIKSNELFYEYMKSELDTLKTYLLKNKINCKEKNEQARYVFENLLSSVVISYFLVDRIDDGLKFFDMEYTCSDSEILKKKIIMFFYNEILRFSN